MTEQRIEERENADEAAVATAAAAVHRKPGQGQWTRHFSGKCGAELGQ